MYQRNQDEIIRLTAKQQNIDDKLPAMERDLEAKRKVKAAIAKGADDSVLIEKESAYIEKCLVALDKVKAANRITALKQINTRLEDAYKKLCDDYDLGRRIYIVQYDQVKMYNLVTYNKAQYDDSLAKMKEKGTFARLKALEQSEEEIEETAILSCALPNSTGQSKMNTLAFVKAILDFSNAPQESGLFETTKSYPMLIDAPFGDIFDKNLEKSAESLYSFTHQIILMMAEDSYNDVAQHIGPHVSSLHKFKKNPNANHSTIVKSSVEVL